jgi:lysylphosphatidylglycerol synthetase-like protein (DUF2156 family)
LTPFITDFSFISPMLSRISLLLAILIFAASLFQRQIAEKVDHPFKEPTQWEKILGTSKNAAVATGVVDAPVVSVPQHPVAAAIFWIALGVVALSLVAWVMEDAFWLPLVAACLALAAVMIKIAWLPALIAALKTAQTRTTRRRSSTSSGYRRTGTRKY